MDDKTENTVWSGSVTQWQRYFCLKNRYTTSFPGFPFSTRTPPSQTSLSGFIPFLQINGKQTAARTPVYILLCL